MKKLNNYEELYASVFVKDQAGLERRVYKGTTCGASCQKIDGGIMVGSIVEGVDGDGTEYHKLLFPFTKDEMWDTLQKVEEDASEIWNLTHGCEECPEGPYGYNMIAPDCPHCNGKGNVL